MWFLNSRLALFHILSTNILFAISIAVSCILSFLQFILLFGYKSIPINLSFPFLLMVCTINFMPFLLVRYMCSVSDSDCHHLFSIAAKFRNHLIIITHTYVLYIISFLHHKSHQILLLMALFIPYSVYFLSLIILSWNNILIHLRIR